ncbi:MAG: restriction endonuclease subunit S [Endomicrobium sp.]|nr:restriction endonuclease subunit S [Endomicrobium sp.]
MGDLFYIGRGNIQNQNQLVPDKNGISFIAQNDNSNGHVKKVKQEFNKVFPKNSIVIGRQTAVIYFQPENFITTDGVLVLMEKKQNIKNSEMGLYITVSIKKQLESFSYSNTVSSAKLNSIEILLPCTSEGSPDFEYMTQFIKIQQKLAIKSVIEWKDKQIGITKQITTDF